ncbi:MAG: tetratricopeptide repeat protein [bacterium]
MARALPRSAIFGALALLVTSLPARGADKDAARTSLAEGDREAQAGHAAEAVAQYEKALAADDSNVEVYARLGNALVAAGNFERAVKIFGRYVEIAPRDCHARSGLGLAYLRQGLADQAVKSYEEAIALCPEEASAFDSLGAAYEATHDPIEAIEALRHAIALTPEDVSAYRRLAKLTYDRKLFPESIAAYEALLARPDPGLDDAGLAQAHERLALMYDWAHTCAKALPHWQAVAASPASDAATKERAQKRVADCRGAHPTGASEPGGPSGR